VQRHFSWSIRSLALPLLVVVCLLAACTSGSKSPSPPSTAGQSFPLPSTAGQSFPVPAFEEISRLLSTNQGVSIGDPISVDGVASGLLHFQRFSETGSAIVNAAEQHSDGCIYVAYTPPKGPLWYDSYWANDASPTKSRQIAVGANDSRPFSSGEGNIKDANENTSTWQRPDQAFRGGRGPAPRWFTLCVPKDVPPTQWSSDIKSKIPPHRSGVLLLDSGAYCFWDEQSISSTIAGGGPPGWQTVLPLDTNGNNGQKKFFPDDPLNAVVNGIRNYYPTWQQLVDIAHNPRLSIVDILRWRGHPSFEDLGRRRMPWMSSTVEGIVTNSFLSGYDYGGNHRPPRSGYYLGNINPESVDADFFYPAVNDCASFGVQNKLCDDWVTFVRPEIDYEFTLGSSPEARGAAKCCLDENDLGQGNLNLEHQGSLENEIEEWLVPGGYRPEPGDRIVMTGRWIVDCGHADWHTELHPIEAYVSSHTQTGRADATDKMEAIANVVVTGDWTGNTLAFDVWPTARPRPDAKLRWQMEPCCYGSGGDGAGINVSIQKALEPADNPNHLHITIVSRVPAGPLLTKNLNDVYPDTPGTDTDHTVIRRLATRFHVWWEM